MKSVRSPFLSPRACQWIDRCRLIFALFSVSSFFAGSFFAFAVVAAVAGTSGTKKKSSNFKLLSGAGECKSPAV